MRRMLLVVAVAAIAVALLGGSAGPALANDRDHRDHRDRFFSDRDRFFNDHDFVVFDFDDEDDNDWACIDNSGTVIFFVDGPTDCPAGFRAKLILGNNDDNDHRFVGPVGRHNFFVD